MPEPLFRRYREAIRSLDLAQVAAPSAPNLVALLDAIGVQRWLGIAGCATLFGEVAGLVQVSAQEARQLPDALYIPMGASVSETLDWLAAEGVIPAGRVLHGLPHPSGANAERVAYFLGRKERAALSSKTNGAQMEALLANRFS